MRKNSKLTIILDKNLYGRGFYISFLYLVIGLIVQFLYHWIFFSQYIVIYLLVYLSFVLITGFLSKNFKREYHTIGWLTSVLLFVVSIFSKSFGLTFSFEESLIGLSQRMLVLSIAEIAFLYSLMNIVVAGQRTSIRKNLGLEDKLFDKEKKRWARSLNGFPNLSEILESLDGGRFIASLFEKGFFNLTILWSCSVMEETIDAIADGIIREKPETMKLFRKENGLPRYYPLQLRKLGYRSFSESQQKNKFNTGNLWSIRKDIAHHNYKPKFNETKEALKILISFMKEMPNILQDLDRASLARTAEKLQQNSKN